MNERFANESFSNESALSVPMSTFDRVNAILEKIEPFFLMALILFGLFGNTISLVFYLKNKSRLCKYTNSFLVGLCVVDSAFLLSLLVVYLRHINLNIFDSYEIVCRLTVFSSFTFSFLSSWFVALFACKRFVLIYFPYNSIQSKHTLKSRSYAVFYVMLLFSLAFYSHWLWASGIEGVKINGEMRYQCVTQERWTNLVNVTVFIDSFITILMPFFIISIMNFLIALRIMKLHKRTKQMSSRRRGQNAAVARHSVTMERSTHGDMRFSIEVEPRNLARSTSSASQQRLSKYMRSTRILFVISIVFMLLNAPMALLKMKYSYLAAQTMLEGSGASASSHGPFEEFLERITCYLYYLNFSCNFLFYFLGFKRA